MKYNHESNEERDKAVERLREFLRFDYTTGTAAARRIGVRDTTLYSWLSGKSRPRSAAAARIVAFLGSLPMERAGIVPIGYEYREYKNWRGIPKPRRCPFCTQAKGEIRKARTGFQVVCPNCGERGRRGTVMIGRYWLGMGEGESKEPDSDQDDESKNLNGSG